MGLLKKPRTTLDAEPPAAPEAPRGVTELLSDLRAESPATRRVAARELSAHPEAASALIECFGMEADRAVREVIGTSLVSIGSADAPERIGALLRADDATLRNDARELMLLLPGTEQIARELLSDPEPEVRMFAVESLISRLGAGAADELSELLDREGDVNVIGHICEKLGEIGAMRHIDMLQSLRERVEPDGFLSFVIEDATAHILERGAASPQSSET